MSKKEKNIYYSLNEILKKNADYNMIIGERSNGKTYSVLEYGLKQYCSTGKQMALIRRWDTDFIGKRGRELFNGHIKNGLITKLTKGQWTGVTYQSSMWYLSKYDEGLEKTIKDIKPFCYAFSLNAGEHDKSSSFPDVTTILFDEFITRKLYLPNEFVDFVNVLSTIIRNRDNVKIFMCGNTVNKYNPYFEEMGLTNAKTQKQNTIDLYTYGDSGLSVAVEYCGETKGGKKSDKYFAFDNPHLQMIKSGMWELDIYPHLPEKYTDKEVLLKYFIDFNGELLQCNIINKGSYAFTYIHRKTTPIKDIKNDIVFSTRHCQRMNYFRYLTVNIPIVKKIYDFFRIEKVFYQSNEVGEVVYNYLKWCRSEQKLV